MIAIIVFVFWCLPIGILSEHGPLPENGWILALAIVPLILALLFELAVS